MGEVHEGSDEIAWARKGRNERTVQYCPFKQIRRECKTNY